MVLVASPNSPRTVLRNVYRLTFVSSPCGEECPMTLPVVNFYTNNQSSQLILFLYGLILKNQVSCGPSS